MPQYPYISRGAQANRFYKSQIFNIDNGAGATIDDIALYFEQEAEIISIRPVYTEATDTTGAASANYRVGTTAGGTEIVASTALDAAKAVGGVGAKATLVSRRIPPATSLFIRHTGVAVTEVGQYFVQVEYRVKP